MTELTWDEQNPASYAFDDAVLDELRDAMARAERRGAPTVDRERDPLGERMKMYELAESGRRLLSRLPVLARIDGKCFHRFTRGMARPFDERLSRAMTGLARFLATETAARCAYVQSDEISLLWHAPEVGGQVYFDGRVFKMTSILAALASTWFQRMLPAFDLGDYQRLEPLFDARVWVVPDEAEAVAYFHWREQDATRNSVSMAASSVASPKELFGKSRQERLDLLFTRGINWNSFPLHFKRGTFALRRTVRRSFTAAEVAKLPPKHAARTNPDLIVERAEYETVNLPPLAKLTNAADVLFRGAAPQTMAREDE